MGASFSLRYPHRVSAEFADAPALRLIRRRLDAGRLREFVYSPDGSEVVERMDSGQSAPVGVGLELGDEPGQLVARDPRAEDSLASIQLPPLRFGCEGTGGCCGLFHHIPVLPEERDALLATVAADWEGFVPLEELVHPAFEEGNDRTFNVAAADGCCAFVRPDGLCAPHVRGGLLAKPLVCRSFPCTVVVCGDEWHGSVRPECACMTRTALEGPEVQGDVESWLSFRASLLQVQEVPEALRLQGQKMISRSDYRGWLGRTVEALHGSDRPVTVLRSAARELGLGVAGQLDDGRPPQVWLARVVDWLVHAEDRLVEAYDSRSPYRLTVQWARKVAAEIAAEESPDRVGPSGDEVDDWSRRASVAAGFLLYGHGLLEARELGSAVLDLGHFLWLAREANGVQLAEEVDSRLESTTSWLFLWRAVGLPRREPPLSFSVNDEPCLGASGPLQPGP